MEIKTTRATKKTPFLNLNITKYVDTKGNEKEWAWSQRPNDTDAVVIVPIIRGATKEEDKMVVIKEFRVPIAVTQTPTTSATGYEYGFPAGLVDNGEDKTQAAIREVKEETGLDVVKVLKTTPYLYNSAGMTNERAAIVYVEVAGEINKDGLESSEEIEAVALTRESMRMLMCSVGLAYGAKAYIILSNWVEHGII